MRIGIDIDGVLTNDDDYILDFTSKYCYEHGLKGFDNANLYEYKKLNWDENTINNYREEYYEIAILESEDKAIEKINKLVKKQMWVDNIIYNVIENMFEIMVIKNKILYTIS